MQSYSLLRPQHGNRRGPPAKQSELCFHAWRPQELAGYVGLAAIALICVAALYEPPVTSSPRSLVSCAATQLTMIAHRTSWSIRSPLGMNAGISVLVMSLPTCCQAAGRGIWGNAGLEGTGCKHCITLSVLPPTGPSATWPAFGSGTGGIGAKSALPAVTSAGALACPPPCRRTGT
jgi:hypothetical protein